MNRQVTPEFFYAISSDFNYREYLEERSHFDRVVISIDDQTAAIVGSGQRLADRVYGAAQTISGQIEASGQAIEGRLVDIDASLCKIDQTLENGFQTVTVELQNLGQNIVDLQDALTAGLNSLLDESRRSNQLISKLIQKVETPDQVWAEEKLAIVYLTNPHRTAMLGLCCEEIRR
ncbi:hypothetical protein [Roseovarius sp. TE539]|uniref:hypothetical protein n=1 Tax=Roseovarius sp. TE539 TaxID=2249812 RepID=UPI0011BF7FFE|nr:hypothetical protein [Roseovarius sp. TE539]